LTVSGLYLGFVASGRRWHRHAHKRRRSDQSDAARPKAPTLTQFCFKYHYWAALIVMIPWLIVITAGLVLQLRHEIPGTVPDYQQGVSTIPVIEYQQVLEIAKTIPELQVEGWSDIWRVYTQPGMGIMEIRTKIGYGAQLDAATGKILDVYARGSEFWEDLHEGIFGRHQLNGVKVFGDNKIDLSKWVFLPVNILALFLWFSGVVVALRTTVRKGVPKSIPAAAKQMPSLAAASGGTLFGPDVALPVDAAETQAGEARGAAGRRRTDARRAVRRHADVNEGGNRTATPAPKGKGVRLSRNRGGWRRRTG
jgi:hypothetical protein